MASQDNFIEKLSDAPSLRGFLALSVNQFSHAVEQLINRVFRKKDFVVESVVNSLFEHQGPLAELPVRLKVLVSLGAISMEVFQDINLFIELKEYLSNEVEEFAFSDPKIIDFIKKLHHIDLTIILALLKQQPALNNNNPIQYQMQQARLDKMIRSTLILAVSSISEKLDIESPL
ncbi:MltR family transcriptional regulator [Pasteurella atlantica]|uniref:MltR family transcriptional regulator n=2 Tax=Pasteurellaceae TaxID=712 RepID=A0ACC6HP69_9PAST|nr:MltR family transcriptional regulator [Pasteurella atlantica]MDP8034111.1 MltR family transcriptional regulator [Pasteurella atlantica]MDP8035983.1 MltR family transcriptional regulator [Pasteurella atlantica]MDP8037933.1 MltR family transcriptional regulator [Pasteurella atlantica]MDP8048349.1 MltR family transcriptional regulator [Pasteurella atlantica]MDP8050245.1 MltR family transcriptional regulator [Pasteurella atlantica]